MYQTIIFNISHFQDFSIKSYELVSFEAILTYDIIKNLL